MIAILGSVHITEHDILNAPAARTRHATSSLDGALAVVRRAGGRAHSRPGACGRRAASVCRRRS
jgi:hypothetical protein